MHSSSGKALGTLCAFHKEEKLGIKIVIMMF